MTCITYFGPFDKLRAKKEAEDFAIKNDMKIVEEISTGIFEGYYRLERC